MVDTATMTSRTFDTIGDCPPNEVIFGTTPAMGKIRQKLEMAARAKVAVLLLGQSGTGKEVLAKYIHSLSPWRKGPFVKVSCPAIPTALLESEFFGHEKGSFTGAYMTKPGRVELADRGTLFLDEIGELEPTLQAKLLELLQDGEFCRIGASVQKRIDVRFVCATNRLLEREMESGTFREDLFYRISVFTIQLPPLRDRAEDIPVLVNYFLESYRNRGEHPVYPLSLRLINELKAYSWPGNIRELENVIKNYVLFGSEDDVRSAIQNGCKSSFNADMPSNGAISLKKTVREAAKEFERSIIVKALETHLWNRRRTARALGISYSGLLSKMRAAGMPPTRGPRSSSCGVVSGTTQRFN